MNQNNPTPWLSNRDTYTFVFLDDDLKSIQTFFTYQGIMDKINFKDLVYSLKRKFSKSNNSYSAEEIIEYITTECIGKKLLCSDGYAAVTYDLLNYHTILVSESCNCDVPASQSKLRYLRRLR